MGAVYLRGGRGSQDLCENSTLKATVVTAPSFRATEGAPGFPGLVSPRGCWSCSSGCVTSWVKGAPAPRVVVRSYRLGLRSSQWGRAQHGRPREPADQAETGASCQGEGTPATRSPPGPIPEAHGNSGQGLTPHRSFLEVLPPGVARPHYGQAAATSPHGGSPPTAAWFHLCLRPGSRLGVGTHLVIGAEAVHLLLEHGHPQVFAQELEDI